MKGSGWVLVLLSTIAFLNYLDRGIQAGVVPNWNCPCTCEKSSPRDWNVMTCCDNGAHGRITTKNNTCSLPNGTTHAPSCTCPAGDGALTCVTDCADFGPVSVSATGILVGIFFGGYSLAAPFFAHMIKYRPPFKIVTVGLFVWILAVAFSGLSHSFGMLAFSRVLSGIGEASFSCVATPWIQDNAPEGQLGRWLAIYFCAIPFGYAAGFGVSGILAAISWRLPFFVEAGLMLLPAIIIWFVPYKFRGIELEDDIFNDFNETNEAIFGDDLFTTSKSSRMSTATSIQDDLDGSRQSSTRITRVSVASVIIQPGTWSKMWEELKLVLANKEFQFVNLGYAAYTFVIGGLSFVGPEYCVTVLSLPQAKGNLYFGGIVLITGLIGTPLGGIMLDVAEKRLARRLMKSSGGSLYPDPMRTSLLEENSHMGFGDCDDIEEAAVEARRLYLSSKIATLLIVASLPFFCIATQIQSALYFLRSRQLVWCLHLPQAH